jgi:excisionase family DNA binding protein
MAITFAELKTQSQTPVMDNLIAVTAEGKHIKLVTLDQASKVAGVSRVTVRNWIHEGRIRIQYIVGKQVKLLSEPEVLEAAGKD